VTAVLLADGGVTTAFGALALVAAVALVPALLLPSAGSEKRLLAARDAAG
jgi:hypothetical protein